VISPLGWSWCCASSTRWLAARNHLSCCKVER
jgi:hypothetical protein